MAKKVVFLFIFFIIAHVCFAQNIVTDNVNQSLIGDNSYFLQDTFNVSNPGLLDAVKFTKSKIQVINLGMSDHYFWIKFDVLNRSSSDDLALNIDFPTLNYAELFVSDTGGKYKSAGILGNDFNYHQRSINTPTFIFLLNLKRNLAATYYLKIKGNIPLVVPIFIGKKNKVLEKISEKNILFGCYTGIILCMLLYNLFLMFSIREDKSYFWYVLHTLFVGLTQASFFGYSFQYLWPGNTWINRESIFVFTCVVSIVGIIFLQSFLSTKKNVPKLNKVFYVFFAIYIVILALAVNNKFINAYKILQPTQGIVALFIIFVTVRLISKDQKQARFYLLSWLLFLISIIIFAIKDYNIIPYNLFTSTVMLSGSAVQVILLSFALGDKINIYKGEKELSQAQTLAAVRENERIVREQNVILERKVEERTYELQVANDDLNIAMTELKEAETQLVESEKMASLGQLTAGIAHEINNPINFVTSNVKPLNRDVRILIEAIDTIEKIVVDKGTTAEKQKLIEEYKTDIDYDYLKEEIDQLLAGIGEGASRTAEIVKGLRIFSRLDENDLKKADINEGIDSTLVITNNLLNNIIRVEKQYANLPLVECYPGKLNQVFLNIISNGIYAVKKKFGEAEGGLIIIATSYDEDNVFISLKDNGTGMDENTKKRLFEPFFTTKDVGEGTGLGLSISYNTIHKHNGSIVVNTAIGAGTEFILSLPLKQK